MEKTANYQLNQWGAGDAIRRADFNADNARIDTALAAIRSEAAGEAAAAQATGDRGLGVLKKLAGDVCRLAYQQDGKGTYTGENGSFIFDGLGVDNLVESTAGAAVLEPDNGQVRLAVDGWSGGTTKWTATSASIPHGDTTEFLSEEWSPAGNAKAGSLTFTAAVKTDVSGDLVAVHVVLMRGEEELAATNTVTMKYGSSSLTCTFSTAADLSPQETYHLKAVLENVASGYTMVVNLNASVTITTTAVKSTAGSFTAAPFALSGTEIQTWAQYSEPGAVTMDLLSGGTWTAMELAQETDSRSPAGETCKERKFKLNLPEEAGSVQLRVNISSESECYIYGYGAIAL
ncbi:MAG: hypothetical protein ACI3XJ_12290 [Oscillospiraceae bacterium]